MKIKILKPYKNSGYFANKIIEVDEKSYEEIKKYNEVEIIKDESNTAIQHNNEVNNIRKSKKTSKSN